MDAKAASKVKQMIHNVAAFFFALLISTSAVAEDVSVDPLVAKGQAAIHQHDFLGALELLRPLAEQGNLEAEVDIGYIYENQQEREEAASWYRNAAEQGYTPAEVHLGYMYLYGTYGRGVKRDPSEALDWWTKASEHGDGTASFAIGRVYLNGQGVARDLAAAFKWSLRGAEQGNAWAQGYVANAYRDGAGVAQNYGEAYFWESIASKSRPSTFPAAEHDHLSPDEIAALDKRIQHWKQPPFIRSLAYGTDGGG